MNVWLLLICMGVVTYAIRLSMIGLIGRVNLPSVVQWALCLVPPAVLSAIIFPELLMPKGTLDLSFGNLRLLAGALAAPLGLAAAYATDAPAGPCIVLAAGAIFAVSALGSRFWQAFARPN